MTTFNYTILQPRIGDMDACILIKIQNKNILINCPGGTQRIFNSYNLNLNNIDYIIITKSTSEHIEGLLGLLMTQNNAKQSRLQLFYYYQLNNDTQLSQDFYNSINSYTYDPILSGDAIALYDNQNHYVNDELFIMSVSVRQNQLSVQIKPTFAQEKLNLQLKQQYNLNGKHLKELKDRGFIQINGVTLKIDDVFQKMYPNYLLITKDEIKVLDHNQENEIHLTQLQDEKIFISYPIAKFIEFYNSQGNQQTIHFDPSKSQQLTQYTIFPYKKDSGCINLIYNELQNYQQHLEQGQREKYVQLNNGLAPEIGNRFKLIMLGTGCSIPNKYNNVQAQLLIDTQNNIYYLIDCGESTLQQLSFSGIQLSNMENLIILFTHEHADHYLGISSFLNNYMRYFNKLPPIVCQNLVMYYIVQTITQKIDIMAMMNQNTTLQSNQIFVIPTLVPNFYGIQFLQQLPVGQKEQKIFQFDYLGNTVQAFRTNHTHDSLCYLLHIDGYKIMFSGDLRPLHTQECWPEYEQYFQKAQNEKLVVIHEATYTEIERANAEKNQHSIYEEVLDFARIIKTDLLFITHFSVRHCKQRLIDDNIEKSGVIQCYDYIQHRF